MLVEWCVVELLIVHGVIMSVIIILKLFMIFLCNTPSFPWVFTTIKLIGIPNMNEKLIFFSIYGSIV